MIAMMSGTQELQAGRYVFKLKYLSLSWPGEGENTVGRNDVTPHRCMRCSSFFDTLALLSVSTLNFASLSFARVSRNSLKLRSVTICPFCAVSIADNTNGTPDHTLWIGLANWPYQLWKQASADDRCVCHRRTSLLLGM